MHIEAFLTLIWMDFSGVRFEGGGGGGYNCKKSAFFGKSSVFIQNNGVGAVLGIFCFVFSFRKLQVMSVLSIMYPQSGF